MLTALLPRVAANDSISRNRTLLFEVYASGYFPTAGVFDPADAIALWAKAGVTWLGNNYQRRIVSHSAIEQFISGQFNNVTLTLENADRYLSAFVASNNVNGMRLVARYINIDLSTTLADSVVRFVGRLEAPTGDLDREQGELTAQEELASLDQETPRRKVSPEDPQGRSPNDPLYEGFGFNARPSVVKTGQSTSTSHSLAGSLLGGLLGFLGSATKNTVAKFNQWSSVSETDGAVVPLICGRVQREGMPVFWTDIGFYIIGLWVYSGHKITSITNFQLPDSSYIFYGIWANPVLQQSHVHLGDPGGTGTNATPDTIEGNYPQNTALLSCTGYTGFAVGGPETATQSFANPQMDAVPTLVAIVCGECDLPDGSGVFNQKGFSDSPVYLARFVLTAPEFFGLDPRLVYDGELPAVHAERQRPIIDKSNGEFLALMSHDASALTDGRLTRLNSTGLIDSRCFRHIVDPGYPDPLVTNRDDVYSAEPGGEIPGGGDHQLTNGAGLAGQSVGSGAWKYYYIDTPVGADQLQITATGSGDGTSFLRLGSKPTLTDFDAFAYTASPQVMTITNPTAGRWWIGIAGFQPDGTVAAGLSYSIIGIVTGGMVGQVLPIRPAIRKAHTLNVPLTAASNAIDFLNNVVLASARMYRLTDSAGRQRIRAKKASDSAYLMAAASIGATSVLVANVEPWRASLTGYLLINVGLVTSEYRKITSALYNPTTGNAVGLTVSGTGLTASGSVLSGGSTSVPASGTVAVVSVAAVGAVLTVTIFGIPITYTVTANDDVNSIAGMLSVSINADPNLRQYVRAVWDGAHTVTIYCTIGNLGFAAGLVSAHTAQLASPLVAPIATSTTSGTLIPGIYSLGYSLVDGSGNETLMSPLRAVTITSGQKVSVSSLGSLPAGAAEVNWYFSPAHDDDHVQFLLTNSGGSFTINTVPDPDSDFPPGMNTTGGETIRVMEVFNALNIRANTFKWVPSQSQTNQVTGTFIDAANGFKPQPVTVNDIAHQRAVRKINKQDINLSGVDNFSQAMRLCFATLAEERDAGERWKWATDDAGIPLEIGDVVAVNGQYVDPSGVVQKEFVNVPVMLENTSLQEDLDVSFVGVFYSTSLLEGQTGRKPVVIPTTLKYFTEAPPVASNVVIVLDDTFLTGFIGDFDFGSTAGTQSALIYIKGPAESEPDDSEYKLLDVVVPDASNKGHFEVRAAAGGKFWLKIVTQSQFGKSAASGHPVEIVDIRPAAVSDVKVVLAADGDFLISCIDHARTVEKPITLSCDVYDAGFVNYKGTLPMTTNTAHAALMNSVHVAYDPPAGAPPDSEIIPIPGSGDGTMIVSTATDKNNLFSLPWDGVLVPGPESGSYVSGVTLEAIESTYQRFDATMQWLGADGSGSAALMTVALQTRANANPVSDLFTPDLSVSPLSVTWSAGTLPGTVKETIKSFGVTVGTPRDNLDPGFGSSTASDLDTLAYETYRRGQRYSFVVVGNEYRLVLNFGAQNQQTLAVVSADGDGPAFPLRLAAETTQDLNGSMAVMNITRGGDQLSTIYSVANQVAFQGSQQSRVYLRIYQNAKAPLPAGIAVDITAPPL
jgi:Putative phage tail protein